MSSDERITEYGVVTLSDEAWEHACRRVEIIAPLATLEVVGHQAADVAAQALGLSRRQVYVLIRRAKHGSGLVTDLVPGQSVGGKGKGRLPDLVERIIRELLQKRFLTKQKRSLAAFTAKWRGRARRRTCGYRRATLWLCGSPTSIRSQLLAAEKDKMPPVTCKVSAASRRQSICHWSGFRSTTRLST
jgi:putative transposase